MTATTFNPRARLMLVREGDAIVAVRTRAPVRGRPLRTATFARAADPIVFDLLLRLATTRAGLDVTLDEAAWQRLDDAGLLVAADEVASPVYFRCDPDDPPRALVPLRARRSPAPADERLIVNPTLRYQDDPRPPAEGRTAGVGANPFASGCAWAWVEHPGAAVPGVLSIAEPARAVLRRLIPGAAPPPDLDAAARAALARADVLVDPADAARRRDAATLAHAAAAAKFRRDRYAVVEGLLHATQVAALRRYFRELVAEGHAAFDAGATLRHCLHNEPMARWIHHRLAGLATAIADEPVKPSYVYFAAYTPGARLDRHVDRAQCVVSITLLIDHEPEPEAASPWPLYLDPSGTADAAPPVAAAFGLGDGLFYRGAELAHWRTTLPAGHASTSLFLHFVPADFTGTLD